jgi:adenine/guanine phosphoribosyltransferase-like PRPP-binding protein
MPPCVTQRQPPRTSYMSDKCVDYLEVVLKPPYAKIIADKTATLIEQQINRSSYDCIVFRGLSGALIAPIVAYKLGKPCVPVRKGESSHSSHSIELVGDYRKYIILDDLISAGKTCREIINICDRHCMKCSGIVLYNESCWIQCKPDPCAEGGLVYPPEPEENVFWPNSLRPDLSFQVYCVGYVYEYCI